MVVRLRYDCDNVVASGSSLNDRHRYSEFDDLRQKLLLAFPKSKHALPPLPPKSVLCKCCNPVVPEVLTNASWTVKFRPSFLEKRRERLEYFFKFVSPSSRLVQYLTCYSLVVCY